MFSRSVSMTNSMASSKVGKKSIFSTDGLDLMTFLDLGEFHIEQMNLIL